jgi:primosomal protein N' (replication factor Y)
MRGSFVENDMVYAGVIIDQAHPSLDKIFLYIVPPNLREKVHLALRTGWWRVM